MNIYVQIERELNRAKEKHPIFPDNIVERVAIMMEEAGEAMQAVNDLKHGIDNSHSRKHLIEELIQTAAMCVRCIESMEEKDNAK